MSVPAAAWSCCSAELLELIAAQITNLVRRYPSYLPFADYLTDMSTYNFNGYQVRTRMHPHRTHGRHLACHRAHYRVWVVNATDFLLLALRQWENATKIPCIPDPGPYDHGAKLGLWCHINGYIQDQVDWGVDAASGQISPGIWLSPCMPDGSATIVAENWNPAWGKEPVRDPAHPWGWTQPKLKEFLDFLDAKGVRSVDVWSSNGTDPASGKGPDSCPMPCPAAPTCSWFFDELRAWKKRA